MERMMYITNLQSFIDIKYLEKNEDKRCVRGNNGEI